MPKRSAGLLLYRRGAGALEVLLVHPGGPFWAKKDDGAWSLPKGEYDEADDPWTVACREFEEELGQPRPLGEPFDLGEVEQAGGKRVHGFALEGDLDVTTVISNTFDMEWPPRSGQVQSFPEVDRAAWFDVAKAREKLLAGQLPLLDALVQAVTR